MTQRHDREREHYCPACDVMMRDSSVIEDGLCPYCGGTLDMDTGKQDGEEVSDDTRA